MKTFRTLKLSNTLSLIETPVKKTRYTEEKLRKKAIKILASNKKRKVNDERQDNFSDTETIPYAEPYRNTFFTKKDEIYRKKAKKKAIKTLTKKKPSPRKTKTVKVVEPKEDDDDDDPELVITGAKAISHPRPRKQLKEKKLLVEIPRRFKQILQLIQKIF